MEFSGALKGCSRGLTGRLGAGRSVRGEGGGGGSCSNDEEKRQSWVEL